MKNRQHNIAPLRIFDGPESLGKLDRELSRYGSRRAVIFCGRSLARAGSALQIVKEATGDKLAGVFTDVQAHSPLPAVIAGADLLKQCNADAAIAVGGGSAIVTARAAGILFAEARDIHELCTSRDDEGKLISPKLLAPKLPQLIVPTTPTTAMAKAGSAVLDPAARSRLALFDPKTRAGSIFLHPELLTTAPRQLLIDAALNTFCSAVEGLMSARGNPISDALLMHAVRLCAQHLSKPDNLHTTAARTDLAYAAIQSGRGTDDTAGGMTTALGHAVAAHCGIDAGLVKTVLLPHTISFNATAAGAGLDKLAASFGITPINEAIQSQIGSAVIHIMRSLDIATRLRDTGVEAGAIGEIAEKAMSDWFLKGNPRPIDDKQELEAVLDAAW